MIPGYGVYKLSSQWYISRCSWIYGQKQKLQMLVAVSESLKGKEGKIVVPGLEPDKEKKLY